MFTFNLLFLVCFDYGFPSYIEILGFWPDHGRSIEPQIEILGKFDNQHKISEQ
jgi:hypothetical protein